MQETTSAAGDRRGSVNPAWSKVKKGTGLDRGLREPGGPPTWFTGGLHEAAGNGRPRWMVANRAAATTYGEQNPAYEPAHPHSGVPGPSGRAAAGLASTTTESKETEMAGKFEIYQDGRGEYRFRLKAGNGEVVATGEGYPTRAGAIKGTEAVQRAADGAKVVDTTDA